MNNHQDSQNQATRRLEKAIRLTPRTVRPEYAQEWRTAYQAARPEEKITVSETALQTARHLRLHHIGATLLGGHGVGPAALSWIAILLFVVLFPLLPLLWLPVLLAGIAFVLVYAGAPSGGSRWLMIISAITGLCAVLFTAWCMSAGMDLADSGQDITHLIPWATGGFLTIIASIIVFIGSCAWSFWRARRES